MRWGRQEMRCWQPKTVPLNIMKVGPEKEKNGVSLYGAIITALQNNFCFMVAETVNTDNFEKFLRKLQASLRDTTAVVDFHGSH